MKYAHANTQERHQTKRLISPASSLEISTHRLNEEQNSIFTATYIHRLTVKLNLKNLFSRKREYDKQRLQQQKN